MIELLTTALTLHVICITSSSCCHSGSTLGICKVRNVTKILLNCYIPDAFFIRKMRLPVNSQWTSPPAGPTHWLKALQLVGRDIPSPFLASCLASHSRRLLTVPPLHIQINQRFFCGVLCTNLCTPWQQKGRLTLYRVSVLKSVKFLYVHCNGEHKFFIWIVARPVPIIDLANQWCHFSKSLGGLSPPNVLFLQQ